MNNDLEQRIQTCLNLLKPKADECSCDLSTNWIFDTCESCFIRRVICDMNRERQVLTRQRDAAVKMLMSTKNGLIDLHRCLIGLHQPLDGTIAAFLKVIDQERKESDACTEEEQR